MNRRHHAIALVLSPLALAMLGACAPKDAPAPQPKPVYVTPVRLDAGAMERRFTATVRPRVESDLALRVGGKVLARQVEVGQTVRAGQVLARIDAADYELALHAAAEQQRAAQVDATQSASDAARFARLVDDGSIGSADLERQRARADAARARLDQAQQQTALARNRVGYAVLRAPFDGVVTALRFESGQVVGEGQPLITLAQPGELEVVADLPEGLAGDLDKAQAQAVAWEGARQPQSLRLRELSPSAAAATRTFRARYALADAKAKPGWRIGSTVELTLRQSGATRSATVPVTALLNTGATPAVWIADAKTGALRQQPVAIVAQSTDHARVTGVADGALVVSVGAQKLDAGLKVRPVQRPLDATLLAEGAKP